MEVIRDTGKDPNIPKDWLGAPILDFSVPSSSLQVVSDGVLTVDAFIALTGLNETDYYEDIKNNPEKYIITSTSTNAGGVSTRVIEPDYVHVDTTVVFQPDEEIRPDYIPDRPVSIID